MSALEAYDSKLKEERKMYSTLIELLSYEKIIFNGKLLVFNVSALINFPLFRLAVQAISYRRICYKIVL